jgi:hypothetical protein
MKYQHNRFTLAANDHSMTPPPLCTCRVPAADDSAALMAKQEGAEHKQPAIFSETALRWLAMQHQFSLAASPQAKRYAAAGVSAADMGARLGDYLVTVCSHDLRDKPWYLPTFANPLIVDEQDRELWLAHLWRAFTHSPLPLAAKEALWNWLEADSLRQIQRRSARGEPVRYAYRTLQQLFPPATSRPADAVNVQAASQT